MFCGHLIVSRLLNTFYNRVYRQKLRPCIHIGFDFSRFDVGFPFLTSTCAWHTLSLACGWSQIWQRMVTSLLRRYGGCHFIPFVSQRKVISHILCLRFHYTQLGRIHRMQPHTDRGRPQPFKLCHHIRPNDGWGLGTTGPCSNEAKAWSYSAGNNVLMKQKCFMRTCTTIGLAYVLVGMLECD